MPDSPDADSELATVIRRLLVPGFTTYDDAREHIQDWVEDTVSTVQADDLLGCDVVPTACRACDVDDT